MFINQSAGCVPVFLCKGRRPMHSFHRSRGKIVVEVLCAFGIAASCVGAWMQTGAWAMLSAAAVAAFFGIFHAFDLADRKMASVAQSAADNCVLAQNPNISAREGAGLPMAATEEQSTADDIVERAESVDVPAPEVRERRRAKAPRKTGASRAAAAKQAKVTE